MRKMKRFLSVFLTMILIVSVAGCGKKDATEGKDGEPAPIKIGVLYPLSGGTATAGKSAMWAAKWVADYINNELGGIKSLGGAKLELVTGDSKGDSETALSEFERMVNVEKVNVLFGLYNTPVANTLSQYCISNQVPCQVTNAVGYDAFSTDNNYVYHANGTNQTHALTEVPRIEWLRENLGVKAKKYAVVYDSADYGRDTYEADLKTKDVNGFDEIVGIPIEAGSADFSSQIAKLKADPDIEWIKPVMSMDDAILFLRQMKEYELSLPVFAGGGGFLQADFVEQTGDASDYVFSTAIWFPSMGKNAWDQDLADKVMEQYKKDMGWEFDESASNAWLGMWCLWDALERAGSYEREDIANAMAETDISGDHYANLLSGIKTIKYEDKVEEYSGLMHYNQNFDTPIPFGVIKDGSYHVIYPESLAEPGFELEWPIPSWDER